MSGQWFTFPQIDPVIFSLGQIELLGISFEPAIRWYGTMYLLGFLAALFLLNRFADKSSNNWTREQVSDLLFYGFLGVVLGGRVGYTLFYQFPLFIENPLYILRITEGGMSFHGGLLGVILAMFYMAKKTQRSFFQVADVVAPVVPIGLGLGRLGNFINGELWGRVTEHPIGMVFPGAGPDPRHPSQLYQFALEGVVLFILLQWFARKTDKPAAVSGMFLVGYGCFRFIVEFFRQPDSHLGLLSLGFSMGQWLSIPMVLLGVYLIKFYKAKDAKGNK